MLGGLRKRGDGNMAGAGQILSWRLAGGMKFWGFSLFSSVEVGWFLSHDRFAWTLRQGVIFKSAKIPTWNSSH